MKKQILNHFAGNFQSFYKKYLPEIKKRSKNESVALCPFPDHKEKKPSFSFNNQTGMYRCFGCNEKGDVFHFYGKTNALDTQRDFPKILKGIADDFGIPFEQKKSKIIAKYQYRDEKNKLLFEVCRYEPKTFRQRQPGNPGWIWNMKGVRRVLYRLSDVLKADEVLLVEGEKDVDNLFKIGFTATTCAMGAGKWRDEYNESLKGKSIVLMPDNDDQGREYMAKVGASLNGTAKSLKWIELPDLPSKGDVSDYIAVFNNKDEAAERLSVLIENAEPYEHKEADDKPMIEFISFHEIAELEFEDNPLIDGLLDEKESLIISGASGEGKSLLTNIIALSLSNPPEDGLWGLFAIPKPVKTLFVQSENSMRAQNRRLNKLFHAHPEMRAASKNLKTFKINNDCRIFGSLTDEDFQKLLIDSLLELDARVLVIDPLISYHEEDENDNVGMRKVLDQLSIICDKANAAAIVSHHYNRQNLTRGAAAIRDWTDNMLLMDFEKQAHDGGRIIKITHDKCRNYEQQPEFYLERTRDLQFLRCEQPGSKQSNQIVAVVNALTEMGGRVDSQTHLKRAVAVELNQSEATARRAIEQALEMKEIIIIPGKKKGQPNSYILPGKSHGQV